MARKTNTRSRRTGSITRQIESEETHQSMVERCLEEVCNAEVAGKLFEALKYLKCAMDELYAPREVVTIRESNGGTTVWIKGISTDPPRRIATLMFDLARGADRKSYEMIGQNGRAEIRRIRRPSSLIAVLRQSVAEANRTLSRRAEIGTRFLRRLGELA